MGEDRLKGSHFPKCIVLQAVYWYLRYALSYRDIDIRQAMYLNRDHRFIKRITKPMRGFKALHSASITLRGIELVRMIRKGQIEKQNNSIQTPAEIFYSLVA